MGRKCKFLETFLKTYDNKMYWKQHFFIFWFYQLLKYEMGGNNISELYWIKQGGDDRLKTLSISHKAMKIVLDFLYFITDEKET